MDTGRYFTCWAARTALVTLIALPVGVWAQDAGPPAEDGRPRAADAAAGGTASEATRGAAQSQGGNASLEGNCVDAAGQAVAATQPEADEDGMAPGNSGSTGWSGGTGGSLIGTNVQGAVPASKTWQPPTARGLDLSGRPEPVQDPQGQPGSAPSDTAAPPNC